MQYSRYAYLYITQVVYNLRNPWAMCPGTGLCTLRSPVLKRILRLFSFLYTLLWNLFEGKINSSLNNIPQLSYQMTTQIYEFEFLHETTQMLFLAVYLIHAPLMKFCSCKCVMSVRRDPSFIHCSNASSKDGRTCWNFA